MRDTSIPDASTPAPGSAGRGRPTAPGGPGGADQTAAAGTPADLTGRDQASLRAVSRRVLLLEELARRCAREALTPGPHGAPDEGASDLPQRLCTALVQLLDADGAAISVQFTASMSVPVGASDPVATAAEQVQFSMGEGPCWQAAARRGPVVFPDLSDPASAATRSVPAYAAQLLAATGYRSAVGCSELLSAVLPCCVVLYRCDVRPAWDAVLVAGATRVVVAALLASTKTHTVTGREELVWLDGPATAARGRVWMAEQLLAEVSGLDAEAALGVLRAVAYTQGVVVDDLADDLVSGRVAARALLT